MKRVPGPKTILVPFLLVAFALIATAFAQEFEINGGQNSGPSSGPKAGKKSGQKATSRADENAGFGWGSSIEVGRLARAAEDALNKGNYAAAADYAERALKAAPNNPRLWFLLGYAARLAGQGQTSLDAYQRGLQMEPGSVEGLSGMAQTYMRMGHMGEAKKILLQVIGANPRRPGDLMMAGELFLKTGDYERAADLLERAESLQPNSHGEVMLAQSYLHLKQSDQARRVLERAKARSPRSPDVYRAVADYYREERDYKDAIDTLRQIPNKAPEVLGELGYTYELEGMKNESADAYVTGATAAPSNITLQLGAALALERNGDIPAAERYLANAEKLDANHYRLHAIRADIARAEDRTQDAIREYNMALANLPDSALEGALYPIQLRLNLSEQYRDASDQRAASQQIKLAEDQIDRLQVEGPMRAEFLRMRASIEAAGSNFSAAENDLKEARQIDPGNINITIQYASMLWRMKRGEEARALYDEALSQDPKNRYALESLGYLARENGDNKVAEAFFKRLEAAYPNDYVAYVALGDLYTAERQFEKAQVNYERGYSYSPTNAQIIAGGANAAIEAHQIPLAGAWLERAKGNLTRDPRVMVEQERYLFHKGKYLESARIGIQTIQALPTNRDANVYLAYDFYNLGRYDDALRLVREKALVLSKEPNFPLLAGHIQKQMQLLSEAVDDYTRALSLDPNMVEAYINRGYVRNDLQDANNAIDDFNYVLKMQPNNGVAHLGIAFSYLELTKGKLALAHADQAEKFLGESGSTHLARATAYRQMRLLPDAEKQYRAALKFSPDNLTLHMALANTLYHEHKYADSITALKDALRLSPDDPLIYARMARADAQLHQRDETLKHVQAAEAQGPDSSGILLATGDALMILGDEHAAMQRFERALDAPDADRVDARLNIAELFTRQDKPDDARQQIALAFAESRVGEASPITTDNLLTAANLFLGMHDFDLAQRYFEKARAAGAADEVVAIGLANTYIAEGNPQAAQVKLSGVGNQAELTNDYDYTMAMANIYRQRHEDPQALAMFARASQMEGEDETAERTMQEMAGQEGLQLNQKLSVASDVRVAPIYDDETIYIVNARLFATPSNTATLPPPFSSLETRWTNFYRVHQGDWPTISGFFQVRNARGEASLPSLGEIINRNTYDYVFDGALNPALQLGSRNLLQFNTGLQATIRRDTESPVQMNQNLFRQFIYMTSSPFGNWLTVRGGLIHEAGPFTEENLSSKELVGNIEFTVGRPWGKTALVTGYSGRDLQFHGNPNGGPPPSNNLYSEFYTTASYVGVQRKFGDKFRMTVVGEYIRTWQTQRNDFATGQAMRPAFGFNYQVNKNWQLEGSFASSRGMGFHDYDNVQSGLLISYVKPLRRLLNDGSGTVPVQYPLRFSFGFQQEEFYNFTGRGQTMIRPIVRLTLF